MAAFTAIDDSGANFSTKLFTGTGSSLGVTGVGQQPDFTWIKNRGATDFHVLTDTVRGATKYLQSNSTDDEVTDAESLKTFDSDGFTVGTMAEVNTNTEEYVSWNWKAGTTTGIDTTGSTITPTGYSFNQDAGFSVITYNGNDTAGALVPHGLGAVPQAIFVKYESGGAEGWQCYFEPMGNTKYLVLDSTAAEATSTLRWNDTSPTSVLFSLGTESSVNGNTYGYVAYCFAEKQGFSKVGIYKGNGNADGTFVYTGFRPAWILIHANISAGYNWVVYDDKREGQNAPAGDGNNWLFADRTDAEDNNSYVDLLSNGFKFTSTNGHVNSATDFIYMAFAEAPLVNSNGVPCNAR